MAELLQHKHCIRCGRAITAAEDYCSEECKEARETLLRKKRRQLVFLYVVSAIVLLLVLLFGMNGGG